LIFTVWDTFPIIKKQLIKKIKLKKMKKLFFILSIVTLVASCGSNTTEGEVVKTDSLPKVDSSTVVKDIVQVDTTVVDTTVVK
jgi:hypothetical protein